MKNLFKTLLAMTLVVALTAGAAPISCVAGETETKEPVTWSELLTKNFPYDLSFQVSGDGEFVSQSCDLYGNLYHVKTSEQFIIALNVASQAASRNSYVKIVLDDDIDLSGGKGLIWDCGDQIEFAGMFDGQNHTVYGLKLENSCFLKTLGYGSVIENVNFEFDKSEHQGYLVKENRGFLTNVHVNIADDSTYDSSYAVALVSENGGTISYCSVNGDFNAEAKNGFASIALENDGSITDCVFNGSIKSKNHANTTFAMVGECFNGSHTARLICNCDAQGSQLYDIVYPSEGTGTDYNSIFYPSGLSLGNTASKCTKIDKIADVAKKDGFDFAKKYKVDSNPLQITFDKEYLKSFNYQPSTTDQLTLNFNGGTYEAEIYKDFKMVFFEIPLFMMKADSDEIECSLTGTLDNQKINMKGTNCLSSYIITGEGESETYYSPFLIFKAGKTYYVDVDFTNIIDYVEIECLDKEDRLRLGFSFVEDPGEITASNMVARWFSDQLELRPSEDIEPLMYMMTFNLDMSYNGKAYPTAVMLLTPDERKADWISDLGTVPQWAIDQAKKAYLEKEKKETIPADMTEVKLVKEEFGHVPPISYINFYSNHDGTEIKTDIESGALLSGIFDGICDESDPDLSYKLTTTDESVSLVDGKCHYSYKTSMEYDYGKVTPLLDWEKEYKAKYDVTANTVMATGSQSHDIKVKSQTKGKTADETYEYVLESGSLDANGKEVRNVVSKKKLTTKDSSGLLGTIKANRADLLDQKSNTFKDQKTVKYYVRQIPGTDKDVTYDKSEYTIEMLIKPADAALKSVATDIKVYKDGVLTKLTPETLSFENVYNESKGSSEEVTTLKKPASVKATAKKGAIQLSWKKVDGAVSYQIQVSTKKSFKKAKTYKKKLKKKEKSKKKLSFNCKKLKRNTKYFIRIRAVDSKGKAGAWSKAVKKKTK